MTLEEKRKIVQTYCEVTPCGDCVLRNKNWSKPYGLKKCLPIRSSSENEIDRALSLINRNSTEDTNNVNHPTHYNDGKIEVIEYIEDKKLDFCLGNAVKYISRAGKKDPDKEIEDLQKAKWYIERRIFELEEGLS